MGKLQLTCVAAAKGQARVISVSLLFDKYTLYRVVTLEAIILLSSVALCEVSVQVFWVG